MAASRRRALPDATGINWQKSQQIEEDYARQLRAVAREIGRIVTAFPPGEAAHLPSLQSALSRYADALAPWAEQAAARIIARIDEQDARKWAAASRLMGRALRREIEGAPTGAAQREFMAEQVRLIKSLPLDAARRVHELTIEGQVDAARAQEIAARILETSQVTASRATLIARTEVARTASSLTMVRAQHIGSEGYIWRTAKDSDVRPSHRKMEGRYVRWDSPPTIDEGGRPYTFHAGQIFNCRCYPEPVIPTL